MNRNISALYSMVSDQVDVVSLDFFDTLFWRPIYDPEDIFDYIGSKFSIADFRTKRRHAQTLGFQKMHREGRKEINIDDIYSCLAVDPVLALELKQFEIDTELTLTLPNYEMVDFLEYCKTRSKKVVVVSDMYLPLSFFLRLLEKYNLAVDEVFVSAELNATKRDAGELFEIAKDRLGVDAARILHVGDNLHSDVLRASEKGFKTFHYQEDDVLKKPLSGAFSASLASAVHRITGPLEENDFYRYGFRYGGPALAGFLDYIEEEAVADRVDILLFVSRDGFILDQVVNEDRNFSVRSAYFKGSRTAFSLASMNEVNFDAFLPFLVSGAYGLSPHELFERIAVTPPSNTVLTDLGLGADIVIHPQNLPQIVGLLQACRWQILARCREVRRGLFNYLNGLGVRNGTRLALVDVGWSGTTLDSFQSAVDGMFELDIHGYFLCLVDSESVRKRKARLNMKSLIDATRFPAAVIESIYNNRVPAELMFSAPHPSIIGYTMDRQGTVHPTEDIGRAKTLVVNDATRAMLDGMRDYHRAFRSMCDLLKLSPNSIEVVEPFVDFLCNMPESAARRFAEVRNFDAWGSSKNFDLKSSDYM